MVTKGLTHWGDQLVLAAYFAAVLLVGIWSMFRANRQTMSGYFLAGRSMSWIPVGASLFSSNIGAEHFIGLAGTGAASGLAIILYEWLAMILILYLGWLFLPVYISAGVYTMPEYLEKRFGGKRIRTYLSCLAVILYILAKLAVSIYAGAVFIEMTMGWDMYLSISVLLAITGIFTVLGGLTAVIYTDTIQTVIMLIGSLILAGIALNEIGGYENLKVRYMNATASVRDTNTSCGLPMADAFNVVRHPVNSDNPFPALLLFMLYGCIWYWCCDQVIVQRALASKSYSHAKAGAILAGYLKLLPILCMLIPGMISRALFPDEIACVDPVECEKFCGNPVGCTNSAYPKLALELLPTGLRGLLMAVMMSAVMSSLSSIFNSSSTLFTMDLYPRIRKSASPRELLIAGRVFIMVMAALSILWIPLVRANRGGLFGYIVTVMSYVATPISPVFVFAIFWQRTTEKAAFWSLLIGQVIGLTRMILDFSMAAPDCGEPDTRPDILVKVNYAYFGVLLSVLTSICLFVISLCTEPVANVDGLTFWTRHKHIHEVHVGVTEDSKNNMTLETLGEETTPQPVPEEKHRYTHWLYKLCGLPESSARVVPVSAELAIQHKEEFMKENKYDVSGDENTTSPVPEETETHRYTHWLYKLCGIPESSAREVPVSAELAIQHKEKFVKENKYVKRFLDLNAVIVTVAVIVMIGVFH